MDGIDDEPQLHVVPVGVDSLFSVNLETMLLSPDFWEGETVRCMLAAWFYPPKIEETSTSRIHRKIYPVDPDLAIELEKAYRSIAPFSATYAAELSSAVSSNLSMAESQAKLRIDLLGGTVAVLFEDGVKGRVYSKGFFGGIGRSGNGSISFGGGQEVLRGWEAVQNYSKGKSGSVTTPTKSSSTTSTPRPSSPTKQPSTSTGKIGSKIVDATKKSVAASPTVTGLIEVLKSKIGVAPPLTDTLVDSTTTTQDVLDDQVDPEPGELSELVLIVHGIGQKVRRVFNRAAARLLMAKSIARWNVLVAKLRPRCQFPSFLLRSALRLVYALASTPRQEGAVHSDSVASGLGIRSVRGQRR